MRISPLVPLAIVLLGATACSYERTSAYTAPELVASAPAPAPEVVVPRAIDGGPGVLNSDNEPTVVRTGLNSDPINPAGTPRPTTVAHPYGG